VDPSGEIGRHANVERAERHVGHDVDPTALHAMSLDQAPLGCQPSLA
jgi:hypothetical protein